MELARPGSEQLGYFFPYRDGVAPLDAAGAREWALSMDLLAPLAQQEFALPAQLVVDAVVRLERRHDAAGLRRALAENARELGSGLNRLGAKLHLILRELGRLDPDLRGVADDGTVQSHIGLARSAASDLSACLSDEQRLRQAQVTLVQTSARLEALLTHAAGRALGLTELLAAMPIYAAWLSVVVACDAAILSDDMPDTRVALHRHAELGGLLRARIADLFARLKTASDEYQVCGIPSLLQGGSCYRLDGERLIAVGDGAGVPGEVLYSVSRPVYRGTTLVEKEALVRLSESTNGGWRAVQGHGVDAADRLAVSEFERHESRKLSIATFYYLVPKLFEQRDALLRAFVPSRD